MKRLIYDNPFRVQIMFSDAEVRTLRKYAEQRQEPKNGNPYAEDKRIIKRDNVETHLIGLLGEYGLSRLLGVAMDVNAYLSGDLIKDFVIHGSNVEVKTLQGYLTFRALSDFKADIAVLANYNKGDYSSVTIQGWTTRDEFAARHFTDDFGYGTRPCLQPVDLMPIQGLTQYCLTTKHLRAVYSKFEAGAQARV